MGQACAGRDGRAGLRCAVPGRGGRVVAGTGASAAPTRLSSGLTPRCRPRPGMRASMPLTCESYGTGFGAGIALPLRTPAGRSSALPERHRVRALPRLPPLPSGRPTAAAAADRVPPPSAEELTPVIIRQARPGEQAAVGELRVA